MKLSDSTALASLGYLTDQRTVRDAVQKHEITPHQIVKAEKKKTKAKREAEFRAAVWTRDKGRSRATGKPLSKSGLNFDTRGEVHHRLHRSTDPDKVYDVENGLLISKTEHLLTHTACPNDPQHQLLEIIGPAVCGKPQTFYWRDPQGAITKTRIG